jgi:hypothetical protein
MYSKIVRITCLAALGLMAAFRFEGGVRLLTLFVVCGAAAFVLTEAIRNGKHLWAIAFALIAVYFNPIFPVELSRVAERTIVLICIVVASSSLRYLKPVPRMSLATITDLPARGESL